MANPQIENGHIDIAHEIAEALMKTNLSAYQSRILWALWRKTYGWHKKEDWISNSQFVEMTGIAKGHVSRAVKELSLRNMVTNSGNKIAFNKDYTQWHELPKGVRAYQVVTDSGNSVTPSGNKVTNSGEHKRNYTKETIQKKSLQKKGAGASNIPYQEIIEYLNQKTKKEFSYKTKETKLKIRIRWLNHPHIEDFKTVIDNKCAQWLNDPEWSKYLRPETLFGTKFEGYLNEIVHPLTGLVSNTTIKNIESFNNWIPPV